METQRCREKFLTNKWLNIADKIAKNKIISSSKIREMENMDSFYTRLNANGKMR